MSERSQPVVPTSETCNCELPAVNPVGLCWECRKPRRVAVSSNENLTAALAWLRGPWQASDNRQHAANVLAEIERLTRDMAALQSQWDDMQQGFVEVFGEPVQDAIELLGTVERIRSSKETSEQRLCAVQTDAVAEHQHCSHYHQTKYLPRRCCACGADAPKASEPPPVPTMQARFCEYKGPLVERDGKMVCPECGNS